MEQEHAPALPKAVRKQIAQANAILDEMKKAEEAAVAGEPATPPKEEPATPPTGEPATPPKEEPATPPEGEPAPTPKEEPAPTPKEKPVEDPAEHKYKVLQGKYNAEVPRLQSDLKAEKEAGQELRQRLLNVEGLLASLQHVREEPPTPPAPPAPTISQEEIDQFGPDLVDLIRRVATDAAKPVVEAGVAPVKKDMTQVRESTSQVQNSMAQSARKRLFATLAEAVPGWEQQNEDPEFLQWLDEVDPFSGAKRGILLTHAFNASDTGRVIALFKGFLTENAAVHTEPADPAPVPLITPEPQTTLDDLVAPGTPKTGSDSAPNESGKRLWTKQDISSLYAAKNDCIVSGKQIPDELLVLERDLIKAQKEGRVRY
ncbi:MAG: hypothetical protein V3W44_08175 [Dehalococcoidales bacterium]